MKKVNLPVNNVFVFTMARLYGTETILVVASNKQEALNFLKEQFKDWLSWEFKEKLKKTFSDYKKPRVILHCK